MQDGIRGKSKMYNKDTVTDLGIFFSCDINEIWSFA